MAPLVLPWVKAADFDNGSLSAPLPYIGAAFVTVVSTDEALQLLTQTARQLSLYLDVTTLSSTDEVVSVLNAGASAVIVSPSQLHGLLQDGISQDRVVLSVTGLDKQQISDALANKSLAIYASDVGHGAAFQDWLHENPKYSPSVFVSFSSPSQQSAIDVAKLGAIPVLPGNRLSVEPQTPSNSISLSAVLLATASSDRPDGLFATLVSDEREVALGLVYSSEESLRESLRTGRGVYQSRKRGLWYKGDSSGDVQELVRVSMDCDRDCIRFIVRQKGNGAESLYPVPLALLTWPRVLPSGNCYLLRTLLWLVQVTEDSRGKKIVCSSGIIHRSSFQ